MSGEMRGFAAHFMQGLALGSSWADKWQAQQIQKEHNKLLRDQHEAQARNQERRTELYAQSVGANVELSRARAQAALRPKGGGGGAAAPAGSGLIDQLEAGAASVGLSVPKPAAPPTMNINVTGGGGGSDPDPGVVSPPEMNKGGMIRKMAGGGSIEQGATMTLDQAQSYGDKPKASSGSAFASAAAAAASKYKPKDKETPKPDTVTPTGPQGSGPGGSYTTADTATPTGPQGSGEGGSYTTADTQPGGVLDTGYRRGGAVRQFQSGGRVMRAIDTGTSGPGSGYGYRAPPPARSY